MTGVRAALADYLQLRRRLGFEMPQDGRLLEGFVTFLEAAGAERISTDLALAWARSPGQAHPSYWGQRLTVVRGFARHLATLDPASEVPAQDLLPAHRPRIAPYIYTDDEIAALIAAAGRLTPPLRALRHQTLIGLLAVTAMRPAEALALDRDDVDLRHRTVLVRIGKQHKQREVPLHDSTVTALGEYVRQRDARFPQPTTPAFFISARGGRVARHELNQTFTQLIRQAGLDGRGTRARPRPYDLRHAFAVRTVLDWYAAGDDVDRKMPLLSTFLGHADPASTYWYLQAVPELLAVISSRLERLQTVARGVVVSALAPTVQAFFTERLITQRNASPHTIAAYRDTFRLLLRFAQDQTGKQPFQLDLDDLDAPLIGAFLTHLEQVRGNNPRTRNARLGAIHSFYRFAALEHPEHAHTIARVMAIPTKRHQRNTVSYLDTGEITALLAAPDRRTWLGRRDHALMVLMIQTGIRVSELTGLRIGDVHLGVGAHIRVTGKGRKMRSPTLTHETVAVIRAWLTELRGGQPDQPLFPTRQGRPLSRYTVGAIITRHVTTAAVTCTTLPAKRITPHTLRHTNAMLLRANNVDIATIALWLGHETTQTTHIYEHADPALKERAIARTAPLGAKPGRYHAPDELLAFLEAL